MGSHRILFCGLLACCALALASHEDMLSGVEMRQEDEPPVARNELTPNETDSIEQITDTKSLKKFIFADESKTQSEELQKLDNGEGEEIAIGDTLKNMEAETAVQDELASEVAHDCDVSEWSKFGKCSKLCDGGLQQRTRKVEQQSQNGGRACPELSNEVECNTDSCASEAYQRRATRRKLTAQERMKETLANKQKIQSAMASMDTHTMMERTRQVMRNMVHTAIAQVSLPGEEEGERSAESQVRKSLQKAMAQNAVTNAMKTYEHATNDVSQEQEEADAEEFKKSTTTPTGKAPVAVPELPLAPH